MSSASVPNRAGGMFSTTSQPWSSSACAAVVRPAPDMPAITSTSDVGGFSGWRVSSVMTPLYPRACPL